jgi:hypothetical protein
MTINLTTSDPTDDATGLTEGGNYSLYHVGGLTAAVQIDGAWHIVYDGRHSGSTLILGLPGTAIRLAIGAGSTVAAAEITELL